MIKPERNKRSLRFFNSCWRFLTHLKSKNKNKPEPEAEVDNVCEPKETIHRGQGEPLQQEVVELPVCDDSFVTCDDLFVSKEEIIPPEEGDIILKEASPERVIEPEINTDLPVETLKKTESSSSDDQFFYQPVSKRREVIEKRILSLKGDVPNVERILKHAEDEIKKRNNDLVKWDEKDRQLIAPHPSEDCLPNDNEEITAEPIPILVGVCDNGNAGEDESVDNNLAQLKEATEITQPVEKEEVKSNNAELCDDKNLDQPSVSTKQDAGEDIKPLDSSQLKDFHEKTADPQKYISESLVNKINVDKENDSIPNLAYPDGIENALENTEYMDEELQESGLEMNQYENNLDDSSDGAQSQTYFSGEISTTPVTEKSYDDQSMSVQPLGRFAGLGDHNFEQMINNSFTIFSVLEERMCEHGSEILTSEENVEILPIESDTNANSGWEGDLTTPSVPMFQYPDDNEGLPNELIKNNTPEPLEQYFEFNSSNTSLQQELMTEIDQENCEKSIEQLLDEYDNARLESSGLEAQVLNQLDRTDVTQADEISKLCEDTVRETVKENTEKSVYLDVESSSVQHEMMTEEYFPSFQSSANFSLENSQAEENEEPVQTFEVEYNVQFQEQNVFNVTNEVEYNIVPETLDAFGITEKETVEENLDAPIYQVEYDVPSTGLVAEDYLKPTENYFEYDPFMNVPTYKPETVLEPTQIDRCENQEEHSLGVSYNGQFQEDTDFSRSNETEFHEGIDLYKVIAPLSSEENNEAIFQSEFNSNGTKSTEQYFDYDPYQTPENFKADILVENNPIDYGMGIGDNIQYQEQNSFNIPTDIDATSKENIDVFELNRRKSFEQNIEARFYQVEYQPTELQKDPEEQYFEYDPYSTSSFKPEIVVEDSYTCVDTQFEENMNIVNSSEDSVNSNFNVYKISDEESFEKNVNDLVYDEHVAEGKDYVTDPVQPSDQYYQYHPFQSSVNLSPEILVKCQNANPLDCTNDMVQDICIEDHFDYLQPTDRNVPHGENFGFYSTESNENMEGQKFNYDSEADNNQSDLLTADAQKRIEHYSDYDPFKSSINLGPEIFVESYQSPTEKLGQLQQNDLNLNYNAENYLNINSDADHEIDKNPIVESEENKCEECLSSVEQNIDHQNVQLCHMEYENENTDVQFLTEPEEIDSINKSNNENETTVKNDECNECLPLRSTDNDENAVENSKDNDWTKSESDFSWDFESQDKTQDGGEELKETVDCIVKEEINLIEVPDEIIKEEPPNDQVSEKNESFTKHPNESDRKPLENENLETESRLDVAESCETQNDENTLEGPQQNDEIQKTRKKRNRKKKGKRAEEEDKTKPEDSPPVEVKLEHSEKEVEKKDEPKETPETVGQEVNRTEEQAVTTNKRNRRKKKQNNQEGLPQIESAPVEETTQEEVTNVSSQSTEQEISQGTELEAKKRRNRRKRR